MPAVRRPWLVLSGLVTAAAVMACATTAAAVPARAGAQPQDPATFRYEQLPADGSVEFAIDAASPRFEFKSGVSAYRAFQLPAADKPYLVDLRSLILGSRDPARARVFYPLVAMLTDDFLVSRETPLEALHFDLPVFEAAVAPAYRLTVVVDPAQARERYLVVYTPAALLEPRVLPAPATPEDAERAAHAAYLGAARYGSLRITVRPDASGAAAAAAARD